MSAVLICFLAVGGIPKYPPDIHIQFTMAPLRNKIIKSPAKFIRENKNNRYVILGEINSIREFEKDKLTAIAVKDASHDFNGYYVTFKGLDTNGCEPKSDITIVGSLVGLSEDNIPQIEADYIKCNGNEANEYLAKKD